MWIRRMVQVLRESCWPWPVTALEVLKKPFFPLLHLLSEKSFQRPLEGYLNYATFFNLVIIII